MNQIIKAIQENKRFIEKELSKKLKDVNKLNIACGIDYREGWVNSDLATHKDIKIDKKVDLRKLPLPFKDKEFDYIYTAHTLEHIRGDLLPLILEFWRILKPNGLIEIRVPHFSHYSGQACLSHKNKFSINGFKQLSNLAWLRGIPGIPELKKPPFNMIKARLNYQRTDNGKNPLVKKNFYYYFSNFISKLANKKINFCERVWCYWVGGFQEMQVILKKIPQDIKLEKNYFNKIIN